MLKVIQLDPNDFYSQSTTLRQKSEVVEDFGSDFQKDCESLIETFHAWKIAVGLSAPQIGIMKRIAIINLNKEKLPDLLIVNPVIKNLSGKKDIKKESCLSLPNVRGNVERRYKLTIDFEDRFGAKQSLTCEGFTARVILHEIDHLDGILFIDKMPDGSTLEPLNIDWN